jgi:glycosyltransferase involved in cell wall biosynthesis
MQENVNSSPVRLLYVIGSLDIGGTEKQLYLLLKYLDRDRFEPSVVTLSPGGHWVKPIRELGVEVTELRRRRSLEIKRLATLARLVKDRRPDIIHGFQQPGNMYGMLVSLLTGRKARFVASRRSFHNLTLHPLFDPLGDRLIFRVAALVICNSRFLTLDLTERYGKNIQGATVHNGVEWDPVEPPPNASQLKQELGIPVAAPVVGTVSRLVPFKNHRLFLDVAQAVLERCPSTVFVIVGGGPLESELRDYARELGIADRVVFSGKRADVPRLLSIFDLFLFTSRRSGGAGEGLSNAVIEAMLSGVPCIASNVSGAEELFSSGEAGFLVDPTDKATFIEKTLHLLAHPDEGEAMGRQGQRIIRDKLSAPQMARRHESLYDSVLGVPLAPMALGYDSSADQR